MKLEREYTDGNGKRVRAVITIIDNAAQRACLERAIQRLTNKARDNMRGTATALDGAVQVVVHYVKEASRPEPLVHRSAGGAEPWAAACGFFNGRYPRVTADAIDVTCAKCKEST